MAYNKKTWESDEVITQEALNNMEDGIAAAHTAIAATNTNLAGKQDALTPGSGITITDNTIAINAAHASGTETPAQQKPATVGKVQELIGEGRRVVAITAWPQTPDEALIYLIDNRGGLSPIPIGTASVPIGSTAYAYHNGNRWNVVELMPDNSKIGDLTQLITDKRTTIVDAINEVAEIADDGSVKKRMLYVPLIMAITNKDNGGIVAHSAYDPVDRNKKDIATYGKVLIGNASSIEVSLQRALSSGETLYVYFYGSSDFLSKFTSTSSDIGHSTFTISVPTGADRVRVNLNSLTDLAGGMMVGVKATTSVVKYEMTGGTSTTSGEADDYRNGLRYKRFYYEVPFNGARRVNAGWIFLPQNYTESGEKTRLILDILGSNGYKLNLDFSAFALTSRDIIADFVRSGYAVAIASSETYNDDNTAPTYDYAGDQLSYNCIDRLYRFLVDNFNVKKDVFVYAGSNGGIQATRYAALRNIPVRAIAERAPAIELFALFKVFGKVNIINKIMHNCGVPSDVVVSHWGGAFTDSDVNAIKSQAGILRLFSPFFMKSEGLDFNQWIDAVKNLAFADYNDNATVNELVANFKVHAEVPTKIWHAVDDANVPYGTSRIWCEAVSRGGGIAMLRTIPAGHGGHSIASIENENSYKIENYQLADGTTVTITQVIAEVLDWFAQWD